MQDKINETEIIKENIIDLSSDVSVKVSDNDIIMQKSGVEQIVKYNPVYVSVEYKDNKLIIKPNSKKTKFVSVSNTIKKIITNTINGFDDEFICKLSIVFSHFPITIKIDGNNVIISNFLGEKKPRKTKVFPGCKVDIKGKDIIVSGNNKHAVGQTAGSLEKTARVRGRDYRVFDDGIYVVEKTKLNSKE